MSLFRLFVPPQAAGANLVYFDFFNATGSGYKVRVKSVQPIVQGSAAVTGVVAVDLYLTKTSAIGTGGTGATFNGSSLTAATITALDHSDNFPAGITARLTPSGGATADAVISFRSVFTEETSAGPYTPALDMVQSSLVSESVATVLNNGQGIRVVQGSVASVGNIGFDVLFSLEPKTH
jgi:hypothetical protein